MTVCRGTLSLHIHTCACSTYDCADAGNGNPCVCRIVALAINLRHSQRGKKNYASAAQKRWETLFLSFPSVGFLLVFWSLISFKQLDGNWQHTYAYPLLLRPGLIGRRCLYKEAGKAIGVVRWGGWPGDGSLANKVHYPVLTWLHFPAGFALILMTLPLQVRVNIDSANWRRGPWP